METKRKNLYVGVDPHKSFHVMSLIDSSANEIDSLKFENCFQGFKQALLKINQVSKSHQLTPIIGVEDTGGNGKHFSEYMVRHSLTVKTVSPVIVAKLAQANSHPEKSDLTDAREVALASLVKSGSKLPSFNVTENRKIANDLNLLVKERDSLVTSQTSIKNRLHDELAQTWTNEYKKIIAKDIFCKKALNFFEKNPSAKDYYKDSKNYPKASLVQKILIKKKIKDLRRIQKEIVDLEKPIEKLVNKTCSYLKSMKGCKEVTAAKICAEVNDINRFSNSSKLAKYAGIAPLKYESGEKKRNKQSKRGNVRLREAVKQIALTQISRYGDEKGKAYYRKKLKEGKTKKQALRCLMRQLVKILFKMLKEERNYY